MQRAFADLKQKNTNMEKVILSYQISLQQQKTVEIQLMSQIQSLKGQVASLQNFQRKGEMVFEETLKQKKETEKQIKW